MAAVCSMAGLASLLRAVRKGMVGAIAGKRRPASFVDWPRSSVFLGADPAGIARIDDFDVRLDELVVLYNARAHPRPALTLRREAGSAEVLVLLDGLPLAVVADGGGLVPGAIRLVTEAA